MRCDLTPQTSLQVPHLLLLILFQDRISVVGYFDPFSMTMTIRPIYSLDQHTLPASSFAAQCQNAEIPTILTRSMRVPARDHAQYFWSQKYSVLDHIYNQSYQSISTFSRQCRRIQLTRKSSGVTVAKPLERGRSSFDREHTMNKLIDLGRVSRETQGSFFSESFANRDANSTIRECTRYFPFKQNVLVFESATKDVDPFNYKNCTIV